MKRQHPTEPNLFWCPKCQTYKARGEFGVRRCYRHGVAAECKKCRSNNRSPVAVKRCESCGIDLEFNGSKVSYQGLQYCPRCKTQQGRYFARRYWFANVDKCRKECLERNNKSVQELSDSYVKRVLAQSKQIATPEIVELKRVAITVSRIERSMLNELTG